MRLALLGGTFDPPHVGHLLAATDALEQLGLHRLWFVPAGRQPLKRHQPVAPAEARLRLLEAMVGHDARFGVDPTETSRDGLSYTVDTLADFAGRYPADERYFLMGADAFATFESWREPGRIASLARLVILTRALGPAEGLVAGPSAVPTADDFTAVLRRVGAGDAVPLVLATRRVDVSSREIRQRVKEGKSIRGFVTDGVADLVAQLALYR